VELNPVISEDVTMEMEQNVRRLDHEGKEIFLVGTAHVSRESADLVERVIREQEPDTVSVELCQGRYQAITEKNRWQNTDLVKVIREKKAFILLFNLILSYVQKRIGAKLGIRPGEEMLRAIETAQSVGAQVHLADRDIRTTLSRTWRCMSFWTKIKLLAQLVASVGELDEVEAEDIEKLKQQDALETLLSEIGEAMPEVRQILIDERDQYLADRIRSAPGNRIVAVVGAGHVPGILRNWDEAVNIEALEEVPPPGKALVVLKWGLPILIVGLVALGFAMAGKEAGGQMIKWWVLANAILAGLGALAALGHPLTVLSAVVAAPITSLNPMIAAGWVSGLVEAFLGHPKVRDFERLPEDIVSLKGFWKNKITRILLVVVFTNIGSSIGTFVAIPLMARFFA
jgi:pheromone shutdown-related protein TraB